MIRRVIIRRFKRFSDVTFDLPGHIVLAGPNNTGKTTILQAVAAWSLAFDRWKQRHDFAKHRGAYSRAPITRQTFAAVPLREFDLLWNERKFKEPIEIEIHSTQGWRIAMEFRRDSTEQVSVRPKADSDPASLRSADLSVAYVPPMTGLGTDEPVYQRPKLDDLLGQGKPGDIIRNLLVEAHRSQTAWPALQEAIVHLFGYELLPPVSTGIAHIMAEYTARKGGPRLDVASAGSGFQQVLMLLTFLYTRPASTLLLDEPDAHLHIILQDAIYGKLRSVAAEQHSQLIVATHSEVIINSVELKELCILLDKPRPMESKEDRAHLGNALRFLTNTDIMLAMQAPGILYTENYTDINILREWARILGHPAYDTLTIGLFWKPTVWEPRAGAEGISAKKHYEILKLLRDDLPALELVDGDAQPGIIDTPITGSGFQRQRWKRYEIESYLIHPEVLARYVTEVVGSEAAAIHVADLEKHLNENYPPAVLRNPLGDHSYLNTTKARTLLLPPALAAAGIYDLPYTRYNEIAALMRPEEIHPEVKEKLDAIQGAFRL